MKNKYYNQALVEYGMMWALKNGIGEFIWTTCQGGMEMIFEQVEGIHLTVEEFQTLIQKAGYLNG